MDEVGVERSEGHPVFRVYILIKIKTGNSNNSNYDSSNGNKNDNCDNNIHMCSW